MSTEAIDLTDFERSRVANEVKRDHIQALHSSRLGERLVRKTVKLIEGGTTEKRLHSPRLFFGKADTEITTLALNAELRVQGISASAKVTEKGWGGIEHYLHLTEVEGIPVKE